MVSASVDADPDADHGDPSPHKNCDSIAQSDKGNDDQAKIQEVYDPPVHIPKVLS